MKWERTFEFSAPVERVWQAFTDPDCEFRAWDPRNAYLAGGAIAVEFTENTKHQSLAWTETQGDDVWAMSVTFSERETGTSVTIVRSGFGDGDDWLRSATARLLGWEHVLADVEVYFRTGRRIDRFHTTPWMTLGIDAVGGGGGVRVLSVIPGTLGARAGVERGDVIVRIGGAPVYGLGELWLMERIVKGSTGAIEIESIRDGALRQTSAAISS